MHTPLPLQRYRLFESHDMDEARESVARVFCPHGLGMLRPRAELDACHHSAPLSRNVSLNYVQYGPGVHIEPGYLRDFFLLQIPLRGSAEIRCGAQQVDATPRLASLPSPTEPLSMRWADDSPHLIVRMARPALVARLEALLQAPAGRPLVVRVGTGYDVHAFTQGDHVWLGGVHIAHDRGVLAHSDGDVVLHALCDAMLGAIALGDIEIAFRSPAQPPCASYSPSDSGSINPTRAKVSRS